VIIKLEELNVPALMTMAGELNILNCTSMTRPQLLDAIQQKLGVQEALIFVPLNATQDPYKKWSLRVSIAAGIIALVAAFASWWGTIAAINKNSDESRESAELHWQMSIVYKIIERESKKHVLGVPLEDLRQQYVGEAVSAKEVALLKDKLSELELRKVLIQLLAMKLVYQTGEDKYITARAAILPGGHMTISINNAQLAIHSKLSTEKGRYTSSELADIIMKEAKVTRPEYELAINLLLTQTIIEDKDKKLYPITDPPPTEKRLKNK
jgi:hypothetical protein